MLIKSKCEVVERCEGTHLSMKFKWGAKVQGCAYGQRDRTFLLSKWNRGSHNENIEILGQVRIAISLDDSSMPNSGGHNSGILGMSI